MPNNSDSATIGKKKPKKGLPGHLFPIQKRSIKNALGFLRDNPNNCAYVGDYMGAGKTIQSIAVIDFMRFRTVLIVCPASVRLTWEAEIKEWATREYEVIVCSKGAHFNKKVVDKVNRAHNDSSVSPVIVICGHDAIHREKTFSVLTSNFYDCLIVDEAHAYKNRKAKRTRSMLGDLGARRRAGVKTHSIWDFAKYKIALSGTPYRIGTSDIYPWVNKMLQGIDLGKFSSKFQNYYNFVEYFSNKKSNGFGIIYTGTKNEEILNKIMYDNFFTAITEEELAKELPPKTWQTIYLPKELSLKEKAKVSQAELLADIERVLAQLDEGKELIVPKAAATHRKEQGLLKAPAVIEFAKEQLEAGIPCTIFAHHTSLIALLAKGLKKYNPAIITGATANTARFKEVEKLQSGETDLFIGNLRAAGEGITLTRACVVLLAEYDWSPAVVAQATNRSHRRGQTKPVIIYSFVVKDSIDEKVTKAVIKRAAEFKTLLANPDSPDAPQERSKEETDKFLKNIKPNQLDYGV